MTEPMINTTKQAIPVLTELRKRIVYFMREVGKKRWRKSEKAATLAQYQQEVEALTWAIMALEREKDASNGHHPTA